MTRKGGGHNLIGLLMDKSDYTDRFGAPFPCPNRLTIYDKSIADGATGVIRGKVESIHRARINNWDALKAAEIEARSFIINIFDEVWYSELCESINFYAQVTTMQMIEPLQVICFGNHSIDILDLQDKM